MSSATSSCSRSSRHTKHSATVASQALHVEIVKPGDLRVPGLGTCLQSVAPARAKGHVTIAIVPDARVRQLNHRYRRRDRVTDVLSFMSDERGYLGDVVI